MLSTAKTIKELEDFYKNKKVLITGHTGFKGTWLTALLNRLGAEVFGFSLLEDNTDFFKMMNFNNESVFDDIRNDSFIKYIELIQPDVIFHLAAQPIVSVGYDNPIKTFSTNIMGTVNLFEGVKKVNHKVSVVNVTTDKVYKNLEKSVGYKEDEKLMGSDPYSSSKSCSELITYSYIESFFKDSDKIISTCRAGNVIGGGDFAENRIVPDLVKAIKNRKPIQIRNFESIRPYQHVLDAIFAYTLLAMKQYKDSNFASEYNVGPDTESIMRTKEIINFFKNKNNDLKIIDLSDNKPFKETTILTLDSSKFRNTFDWEPTWRDKEDILSETYSWYTDWISGYNINEITFNQIEGFLNA